MKALAVGTLTNKAGERSTAVSTRGGDSFWAAVAGARAGVLTFGAAARTAA
jgi:hypothetical protein